MELNPWQRGAQRDPFLTSRDNTGLHALGRAPEQAVQGFLHSPALPSITLRLLPLLICAKHWKNIAVAW